MWILLITTVGVLFFAFVWFDVSFSRGIIYRVEVLNDLEKIEEHLSAIQPLDQRFAKESWWEWDPRHDQRYKTWLEKAYHWAKSPWWRRVFTEPPDY